MFTFIALDVQEYKTRLVKWVFNTIGGIKSKLGLIDVYTLNIESVRKQRSAVSLIQSGLLKQAHQSSLYLNYLEVVQFVAFARL